MKTIHRILIVIGLLNLMFCFIIMGCALMSFIYNQYTDSVDIMMWYIKTPALAIPLWVATIVFAFSTSENLSFAEDFGAWVEKNFFKAA